MSGEGPLLEMRGISKSFFGVPVLSAVDLDCQAGEVHAIVGENGAGKSTLMKILAGAYQPASGEIKIDNKEVHFGHPGEAKELGVSLIYQEFSLLPERTVATSPLTDERLAELAPRIRAWGFSTIELPIENLGDWAPVRTAELLSRLGLAATTCLVMPPGRDLVTDKRMVVIGTQEYLKGCLDMAAAIGAGVVAGPAYAPVGRTWLMSSAERKSTIDRLVEALKPVVVHAEKRQVGLGIEPLNRYETSLINTVEQALEVVERLDAKACGVALDTFHMNIEEKDPAAAIRSARGKVAHVQVCGNDRGAPGNDHTDWPPSSTPSTMPSTRARYASNPSRLAT